MPKTGVMIEKSNKNQDQPLNTTNGVMGNPLQANDQDQNVRMNNVMMLNEELNEHENNENVIRNSIMHNPNMQEQQANVEVPGEINRVPGEDGLSVEQRKARLIEQMNTLDNEISYLESADKMQVYLPKEESKKNADFVARYKSRNSIVRKMSRNIRSVKNRLNEDISAEDISKIERMVEETQVAQQQINKEDYDLSLWKAYTDEIKEIDATMDAILQDARSGDSKYYKWIIESIEEYRKNPTQEKVDKLKEKVNLYISTRTKQGRKREDEFRPKGRVRIQRVKLLAQKLGIVDNFTKYKKDSTMNAESTLHYEGTAAKEVISARERRYEEFLETNKQFKVLKDASTILVTERMLTPEYVKNNMKEMKGYVETINKALEFVSNWETSHQNGYPKTEQGALEKILFGAYSNSVKRLFETNIGLETFVRACESGNENRIQETHRSISKKLLIKDKQAEDIYKDFSKVKLNQLIIDAQMRYMVGEFDDTVKKNDLSREGKRLGGMLDGYWINDEGEFETEKDREIYERNLDFVHTLYYGTVEQYAEKVQEYFERQSKHVVTKEMLSEDYILSHFSELVMNETKVTCKEEAVIIRPEVDAVLKKTLGPYYQTKIYKNDPLHMEGRLDTIAKTLGFKLATAQLLDETQRGDKEDEQQEFQEALQTVVQEIERRDERDKRLKESVESEKKFDTMKAAFETVITKRMMEPKYIQIHLEEMKQKAKIVNNAKEFIKTWEKNLRKKNKSEKDIYEEKIYTFYFNALKPMLKAYGKMDKYIEAIESKNANKIENAQKNIGEYGFLTELGEKMYPECRNSMRDRQLEVFRLQYAVGAFGKSEYRNKVTDDAERMLGSVKGVKLDGKGELVDKKDRVDYENDLALIDTLYNGSPDKFLKVIEAYFEDAKDFAVDESLIKDEYLEEHYVEMIKQSSKLTMRQNLITIRRDVEESFVAKYGADYLNKMDEKNENYSSNLQLLMAKFANKNGFDMQNEKPLRPDEMGEQEKEVHESVYESTKQLVEESIQKLKNRNNNNEQK